MITLYFSGTGNTKYIARRFAAKMVCKCLSIEDAADFAAEIRAHDIIAFAYPNHSSRAPRFMREFAVRHARQLRGKKLVILVTQWIFSGDGARSFTDLFERGHVKVIYAEHFNMPNNVCNIMIPETSSRKIREYVRRAEAKLGRTCREIRAGIVRRRGFGRISRFLGKFQGVPWLAGIERWAGSNVRVSADCTSCTLCVRICPTGNLQMRGGKVTHRNNCTLCYRCVNRCPARAITVMFHRRPPWQYKGML